MAITNSTEEKEIPILFSPAMVRAIQQGRKTITRRVQGLEKVNYAPNDWKFIGWDIQKGSFGAWFEHVITDQRLFCKCPYGQHYDKLWIRETFSRKNDRIIYLADVCSKYDLPDGFKWKPSIHMPKDACRLFLLRTSTSVERLNNISEKDAVKEGIEVLAGELEDSPVFRNYLEDGIENGYGYPKNSFKSLWISINGEESWNKNPWVWVINFVKLG